MIVDVSFTFSFALMQKKKITKRKNQGCTFLPTPVLFSAKQKELASLKQLFVFNAPKSTSASRQKSEANPWRNIAYARCGGCFWGECHTVTLPLMKGARGMFLRTSQTVMRTMRMLHSPTPFIRGNQPHPSKEPATSKQSTSHIQAKHQPHPSKAPTTSKQRTNHTQTKHHKKHPPQTAKRIWALLWRSGI